jgi:hypothetical protein
MMSKKASLDIILHHMFSRTGLEESFGYTFDDIPTNPPDINNITIDSLSTSDIIGTLENGFANYNFLWNMINYHTKLKIKLEVLTSGNLSMSELRESSINLRNYIREHHHNIQRCVNNSRDLFKHKKIFIEELIAPRTALETMLNQIEEDITNLSLNCILDVDRAAEQNVQSAEECNNIYQQLDTIINEIHILEVRKSAIPSRISNFESDILNTRAMLETARSSTWTDIQSIKIPHLLDMETIYNLLSISYDIDNGTIQSEDILNGQIVLNYNKHVSHAYDIPTNPTHLVPILEKHPNYPTSMYDGEVHVSGIVQIGEVLFRHILTAFRTSSRFLNSTLKGYIEEALNIDEIRSSPNPGRIIKRYVDARTLIENTSDESNLTDEQNTLLNEAIILMGYYNLLPGSSVSLQIEQIISSWEIDPSDTDDLLAVIITELSLGNDINVSPNDSSDILITITHMTLSVDVENEQHQIQLLQSNLSILQSRINRLQLLDDQLWDEMTSKRSLKNTLEQSFTEINEALAAKRLQKENLINGINNTNARIRLIDTEPNSIGYYITDFYKNIDDVWSKIILLLDREFGIDELSFLKNETCKQAYFDGVTTDENNNFRQFTKNDNNEWIYPFESRDDCKFQIQQKISDSGCYNQIQSAPAYPRGAVCDAPSGQRTCWSTGQNSEYWPGGFFQGGPQCSWEMVDGDYQCVGTGPVGGGGVE